MRQAFAAAALPAIVWSAGAPSSAQTGSQAAGAQQYAHQLTSAELRASVPHSTSYSPGSWGPKTYANYKTADGRAHIKSPDFEDFGTWRITDDNLLCTKYNKVRYGQENCQTIWQMGPNAFEAHLPNGQVVKVTAIVSGNPEGL